MDEENLRKLFKQNSDCVTDTKIEWVVIQAMTEDMFIKVVKFILQNVREIK